MKEIKIIEEFKVTDDHQTAKGLVCFEDSCGNIIFQKENMIVEDGRSFLFSLFKNTMVPLDPGETEYELYKVKIGSSTSPSSPSMKLEDISMDNLKEIEIESSMIEFNSNGLGLIITVPLTNLDISASMGNVSLILKDKNGVEPDKLFSRVVFKPYIISEDSNIKVKYYINF